MKVNWARYYRQESWWGRKEPTTLPRSKVVRPGWCGAGGHISALDLLLSELGTYVVNTSRRVTVLNDTISAHCSRPSRWALAVCPPPAAPGPDLMSWLLQVGVICKAQVRSSGWQDWSVPLVTPDPLVSRNWGAASASALGP